MNHHSRRVRSPLAGYDPRVMPNNMPEYDDPYHPANQFDGSPHPPQPGGPPLPPAPFMEPGPQHNYPMNYRDQHRLPSTYRGPLGQREVHPIVGGPPISRPMQRASSPPYKILCITNINPKIGDASVKDALTNDFCRFGDISVSICHDSGERLAYIYFRNYEEAREARHTKSRTLFFDRPVDIEPIYEPRGGVNGSPPIDSSPPLPPPMSAIYSPRRRGVTPPDYPYEQNPPMVVHRRHQQQHQQQPLPHYHNSYKQQLAHPTIHHHQQPSRGMSPVDYRAQAGSPQSGGYPHVLSPPPHPPMGPAMMANDRRIDYGNGGYGPPPPHIAHPNSSSPYSSPPHQHEPYRSSHQSSGHYANHGAYPMGSPYGGGGGGGGSSMPYSHHHSSYRSPQHSVPGHGGPPYHHHHSNHHQPHQHHHRSAPDPPVRYLSREYRREKFGADHLSGDIDDGRPSRVLLINNIDPSKSESELRDTFEPFGIIEEMEVKKVAPDSSSALIKFSSMDGAYKAKTANNGRHIGNSRCRIVYGKVSASRRLWIGGLSPATTIPCLEDECGKFGHIISMDYTSGRPYAYVEYESANQAQFAAHHLRTTLTPANERKIRIEFVDPDRSEKMMSGADSNSQISQTASKSRAINESLATNTTSTTTSELEPSPQSTSGRKRSLTPTESAGSNNNNNSNKRSCQAYGLPLGPNTFKHERLAATAAAKARISSTSSLSSNPQNQSVEDGDKFHDQNELVIDTRGSGDIDHATNSDARTSDDPNHSLGDHDEPPSDEILASCTSVGEIAQHCLVSWLCHLALRNFTFPSRILLCSGHKQFVDKFLTKANDDVNENNGCGRYPILRITQRWRLHPQPKLEEVKKRMQSGNLGIFIITAGSFDDDTGAHGQSEGNTNSAQQTESSSQSRPLRNLIKYLEQKDAAGVILLNINAHLLYLFPPCDFAINLIKQKASNLGPEAVKEEYLIGVLVGSNETKI